jgi:hypothetical protein
MFYGLKRTSISYVCFRVNALCLGYNANEIVEEEEGLSLPLVLDCHSGISGASSAELAILYSPEAQMRAKAWSGRPYVSRPPGNLPQGRATILRMVCAMSY